MFIKGIPADQQIKFINPNGKIFGIPRNATTILEIDTLHTPKRPEMCLSPYFNKF